MEAERRLREWMRPCKRRLVCIMHRIARGTNSRVYSAYACGRALPRGFYVLKRIAFGHSSIFCTLRRSFAAADDGCRGPRAAAGVPWADVDELAVEEDALKGSYDTAAVALFQWATERRRAEAVQDGAVTFLYGTEFLTEVAVDYLLKMYLPPCARQHFVTTVDVWSTRRHGNLLMPHAGDSLRHVLASLSLQDVQSVVLQLLVALAWAQRCVRFKHHDLHVDNVYVACNPAELGIRLGDGVLELPDDAAAALGAEGAGPPTVLLPSTRLIARIADFGLSAATDPSQACRHVRADYNLLNVDNAHKWGLWDGTLQGNEGYDIAVVLFHMAAEARQQGVARPVQRWLAALAREFEAETGVVMTSRGRPRDAVQLGSVLRVLQLPSLAPFVRADHRPSSPSAASSSPSSPSASSAGSFKPQSDT